MPSRPAEAAGDVVAAAERQVGRRDLHRERGHVGDEQPARAVVDEAARRRHAPPRRSGSPRPGRRRSGPFEICRYASRVVSRLNTMIVMIPNATKRSGRRSRSGRGTMRAVVHQSTRSGVPAAQHDGDGEGPHERGEDRVVDRGRQHRSRAPHPTAVRVVSAVVASEQEHRVDQTRDQGGDDGGDDPRPGSGAPPIRDAIPMAMRSAKADEPSGRWPRMSSARPPTKAQMSPASRPPAMTQTTPMHEHGVQGGVTDLQIWDDGELCERGHHGDRRGDDELHEAIDPRLTSRRSGAGGWRPRRRSDSLRPGSIPRDPGTGNRVARQHVSRATPRVTPRRRRDTRCGDTPDDPVAARPQMTAATSTSRTRPVSGG